MNKKRTGISSVNSSKRPAKVLPFRKKKSRKKQFITLILFFVVAGVMLYTPLFNIKAIEVSGNAKFSGDEIATMSGITPGQNIFRFAYFKSKRDLLKNQYLEDVKISRHLPNKVLISVAERKPAAYFDYSGSFLTIDRKGIVLDVVNSLNGLSIPSIVGVRFQEYHPGKLIEINKEDKAKFDTVLVCLNEIAVNGLEQAISKIDVTDLNKIVAWAYNDKFQVNLIDAKELPYKFKFLKTILDGEKDGKTSLIIDFTTLKKPSVNIRNK